MRRYYLESDDKNKLDSFPMEIVIDGLSRCCSDARILVESKVGGFITANCIKCNEKRKISIDEFRTLKNKVGCFKCEAVMEKGYVPSGSGGKAQNYGFKCEKCQIYIWASDLVRNWDFSDKLDACNNEF